MMGALRLKTLSTGKQIPKTGIVHVSLPPRTRHDMLYHRRTREWFLVLKGEGRGVIGSKTVRFKPGVIVYMPPGVPHRMMTDASAMEAIVLFSPPLKLSGSGADVHFVKKTRP
jgi:mannose-6-phosphate isomerase-like protein (cupin superfamily)